MNFEINGTGSPIVFLPGLFGGGWIWDHAARACVDHGYSTIVFQEPVPVSLGSDMNEASVVIDEAVAASDGKPVLVGSSMGGVIALEYAVRNHHRLSGVIGNGVPGLVELTTVPLKDMRTGDRKFATEQLLLNFHDKSKAPERAILDIMRLYGERETFYRIVPWYSYTRKYQVVETLRQMPLPLELIWGEFDGVTPVAPWKEVARDFGNIAIHVVEACGHSPMVETPERFTEILLSCLPKFARPANDMPAIR